MNASNKKKVVLAYSGGLDTSIILKWLLERDYEVIAYVADVGQDDDFAAVEAKALKVGASKVYVENLQEELTELGLYTGPIDGDYGKGTKAAIETLQGSCDIEKTGIIDITTRICLDRAG